MNPNIGRYVYSRQQELVHLTTNVSSPSFVYFPVGAYVTQSISAVAQRNDESDRCEFNSSSWLPIW